MHIAIMTIDILPKVMRYYIKMYGEGKMMLKIPKLNNKKDDLNAMLTSGRWLENFPTMEEALLGLEPEQVIGLGRRFSMPAITSQMLNSYNEQVINFFRRNNDQE